MLVHKPSNRVSQRCMPVTNLAIQDTNALLSNFSQLSDFIKPPVPTLCLVAQSDKFVRYLRLSDGVLIAIITLIPFALFLAIIGLELAAFFIQAYVFTLLLLSYIKDAIDLQNWDTIGQ